MYKTFKRTEGVSTTDIVGRMLLMSTDHHIRHNPELAEDVDANNRAVGLRARAMSDDLEADVVATLNVRDFFVSFSFLAFLFLFLLSPVAARLSHALLPGDCVSTPHTQTRISNFLPTSRRIVQFSEGRAPSKDDVVVYVSGAWDLFNGGHIEVGYTQALLRVGGLLHASCCCSIVPPDPHVSRL